MGSNMIKWWKKQEEEDLGGWDEVHCGRPLWRDGDSVQFDAKRRHGDDALYCTVAVHGELVAEWYCDDVEGAIASADEWWQANALQVKQLDVLLSLRAVGG